MILVRFTRLIFKYFCQQLLDHMTSTLSQESVQGLPPTVDFFDSIAQSAKKLYVVVGRNIWRPIGSTNHVCNGRMIPSIRKGQVKKQQFLYARFLPPLLMIEGLLMYKYEVISKKFKALECIDLTKQARPPSNTMLSPGTEF